LNQRSEPLDVAEDIDSSPKTGPSVDDPRELGAREELRRFFAEHSRTVFYLKQLEVLFEKPYYHWVTRRALYWLAEEGEIGTETATTIDGVNVRFFFSRGHRYRRRQYGRLLGIIDEMAAPGGAEAVGLQAELLFLAGLAERGFLVHGVNTSQYKERAWTQTEHDLDYVLERDGVGYGCEVKNRWGYIGREELAVKVEMCKFLGVRPLFIMRAAPTVYNDTIIKAGGFVLIFVAHLYPFGMKPLAERVVSELGLPADSPRSIPSGIVDRFVNWHRRHVNADGNSQ